jgi:hypothetical protein
VTQPTLELRHWVRRLLDGLADQACVLVRDPLHLLPENDHVLHAFARDRGYTVIVAATNLVFRDLYEKSLADPEMKKVLVVDRAPAGRRSAAAPGKAPPPFYPDFLARTAPQARVDLDLREFLHQATGDPLWPAEADDARYARLIVRHLDGVLQAHRNLRTAHKDRFTDNDFKTIVAYAALGIGDMAFKRLDPECYWRICLLGHPALEELEWLVPEVTQPIRQALRRAPAPFCWFGERDPETVLRAFYLAVILAQHLPGWRLLLANVEPALAPLTGMEERVLRDAVPALIGQNRDRADRDLTAVEESLSRGALKLVLLEQMHVDQPAGFAAAIEKESYSTLVRGLALLFALDNLLGPQPDLARHGRLVELLFPTADLPQAQPPFVEQRSCIVWSHLRTAFRLAWNVQQLRPELANLVRALRVKTTAQLNFRFFWDSWNGKRINRLEYFLSALERLATTVELLPRSADTLPAEFVEALDRIRQRVQALTNEVHEQLDDVNRRFQEVVVAQYPSWLAADGEVRLTSQFIRRCVKPHWDPQREKAVIFIFDGMRYDIWDELLRPMLLERMEVLEDYPAAALLPSETEISRWALSAGTEPASFWPRRAENLHLQEALARELGYTGQVEAVAPDGAGTGETVRYRAGNLDVYIFEFCDKELHKVSVKTLPDGREVPSRPLAFLYQQHIKSLIDTEVMAIVRRLAPGTKVFVTADHGFGRVHRERIWLEASWLNEPQDCSYLNAWLRQSLAEVNAPNKVRASVWELPVAALRMPATEEARDRQNRAGWQKRYASIIFPKTGFALCRPNARFNPDAYTHGGISLEELVIPMVVLRVKAGEEGGLAVEPLAAPAEVLEGEEVEFRLGLSCVKRGGQPEELRIDVEVTVAPAVPGEGGPAEVEDMPPTGLLRELPGLVIYLADKPVPVVFRYKVDPNEVAPAERRSGIATRILTVTASYSDGRKVRRKSWTHSFTVQLSAEQVVRRVGNLGAILGLTPKSLRGG